MLLPDSLQRRKPPSGKSGGTLEVRSEVNHRSMRGSIDLKDFDWVLLGLALAIAAIGILEIYSTTAHSPLAGQFRRQIYWVLIGFVLAAIVSRFDYHIILEQTPWFYLLTVGGLAFLLVAGPRIAGARRWLHFGGATFQVSEFAKLAIILVVAALLTEVRGGSVTWGQMGKLVFLVGLPAALVALEPDLGTALTYVPIAVAGVFVAGIRRRQILAIALAGVVVVPLAFGFLRPYQRERLMSFVHPKQDTQGSSYQLTQTKIAIGSGGFWGKGLGNGTQSKLGFIPVSHADAIFAAFAEEQGFAGTVVALLLYFAFLLRLLDGAQQATDRAGSLLLVGFAAVLFFQIAVNIGMMIGYFPITGIPLPLMSEGGSSALFVFLGLGLAMSVKLQRFVN
jgi:rod shape determining protein RodA